MGFSKQQLRRCFHLTWKEESGEHHERWTLESMVLDKFDNELLQMLSEAPAGFIHNTGWEYPMPDSIEASDTYAEEESWKDERECHHLDWWDLKHPEQNSFGFDPADYEW